MQMEEIPKYTLDELRAAGVTAVSVETICNDPGLVVYRVCPRCQEPLQFLMPFSVAPRLLLCTECDPEIDLTDAADASKMRRERERWQPTLPG